MDGWAGRTSEDRVHGQEVRADGECDHGECEGEELVDDGSARFIIEYQQCNRSIENILPDMAGFGETNEGTAGVMFDLGSSLTSSWSRWVFSVVLIRR